MAKIYLIASNKSKVTWANTRRIIMSDTARFSDGSMDFGIGAEPYFICPGCNRKLPVVIFHLDHIKSRARHQVSNLGIMKSHQFVLIDHDLYRVQLGSCNALGGYVTISTGSKYNPKVANVNASDIWENDLRNLQFLCSACNSSKGDRDWVAWGRDEMTTRPLSRIWKNTEPDESSSSEDSSMGI